MRTKWLMRLSAVPVLVQFMARRFLSVCSILIVMLGFVVILNVQDAGAVPPTVSFASVQAGQTSMDNQNSVGPVPIPLILTSGLQQATWGTNVNDRGWYSADSHVDVGFGPGTPWFGNIQADASVVVGGFSQAWASAGGSLQAYFTIGQKRPSPFDPGLLSFYFGASGAGEINGFGRYNADVSMIGSPDNISFHIAYEGYSHQDSFNEFIAIKLQPNNLTNPYYGVLMAATASAFNYSLPGATAESTVSAMVDPIILFNQEEFDRIYGVNTFRLSDYYTIEFSPNLPVANSIPIPTAFWLLGSGFIGLVGLRRKLKK